MSEVIRQSESACDSCVGACCQDVRVVLSTVEAEHIRVGGTDLQVVLGRFMLRDMGTGVLVDDMRIEALRQLYCREPEDSPRRDMYAEIIHTIATLPYDHEYYTIIGRCGYLDANNQCSDYLGRPTVCKEFPQGGVVCGSMRERAEIVRVELSPTRRVSS